MPSAVYFDLATWHLINTVYNPLRVAELRGMRSFYADPAQHRRLMSVVEQRLGHELLARAEAAKITVAEGGATTIGLEPVEAGLARELRRGRAPAPRSTPISTGSSPPRARPRPRPASAPDEIDALYFTGGSTGLRLLTERLQQAFPAARPVRGDRFASVASGLALHAARRFGSGAERGWHRPARRRRRQPSSTAAIASPVASTLPVFRPATQSRPERTR